jgi:hypothetical protein
MVANEIKSSDTVLELGCAHSITLNFMLNFSPNVHGVDFDPKMIADAHSRYPKLASRIHLLDAHDTDKIAKAVGGPITKIFMDLSGVASVPFLWPIIDAHDRAFQPALIVVKAKNLRRFADQMTNGDRYRLKYISGATTEEKCSTTYDDDTLSAPTLSSPSTAAQESNEESKEKYFEGINGHERAADLQGGFRRSKEFQSVPVAMLSRVQQCVESSLLQKDLPFRLVSCRPLPFNSSSKHAPNQASARHTLCGMLPTKESDRSNTSCKGATTTTLKSSIFLCDVHASNAPGAATVFICAHLPISSSVDAEPGGALEEAIQQWLLSIPDLQRLAPLQLKLSRPSAGVLKSSVGLNKSITAVIHRYSVLPPLGHAEMFGIGEVGAGLEKLAEYLKKPVEPQRMVAGKAEKAGKGGKGAEAQPHAPIPMLAFLSDEVGEGGGSECGGDHRVQFEVNFGTYVDIGAAELWKGTCARPLHTKNTNSGSAGGEAEARSERADIAGYGFRQRTTLPPMPPMQVRGESVGAGDAVCSYSAVDLALFAAALTAVAAVAVTRVRCA